MPTAHLWGLESFLSCLPGDSELSPFPVAPGLPSRALFPEPHLLKGGRQPPDCLWGCLGTCRWPALWPLLSAEWVYSLVSEGGLNTPRDTRLVASQQEL